MNIYIMDTDNQMLRVEFTKEELEHELFPSTLNRLRGKKELNLSKDGETVTIQSDMDNIGVTVDYVREEFQGDAIPPETRDELVELEPAIKDSKGKIIKEAVTEIKKVEIPKDLTRCPQFKFTATVDPEPIQDEEKPIEEVKEDDEGRLQEPVLEVKRKPL